jgi:hypothetical protein
MPASGLLGSWQVGDRAFTVTAGTEVKDPAGAFAVGVFVKVHGLRADDGTITAREIELEDD